MATAINASYFTGKIFLPNTATTYSEGQQLLTFINQFEPIFLEKVFGVQMATLVQGEIDTPSNVNLAKIVNGTTYTDWAGKQQKWVGLKNTALLSPVANYVYYQVQQVRDTSSTGIGEMMQQTENATRTNAGAKTTMAWNQMVDWLLKLDEFIEVSSSVSEFATYNPSDEMFTYTTRFGL